MLPHACLLLPSTLQWQTAIDYVHSAPVEHVLADFDGIDATVLDILQRYRVGAQPSSIAKLLYACTWLLSNQARSASQCNVAGFNFG